MRTVLAVAALLFRLTSSGSAQTVDPPVMDGMFSNYDLDAFKGGEWVEYETNIETTVGTNPARKTTTGWKLACVGVEADTVFFETTTPVQTVAAWKGSVVLVAVDKKSAKVTKAWWGKPGEAGREIKVTAQPEAPAPPEITGTGKVSRETVNALGTEYECEKVETVLQVHGGPTGELKITNCAWNSEKVPFRMKSLPPAAKAMIDKLTWETKPTGKGFQVKSQSVMEKKDYVSRSTTVLTGTGTDAKATLKK